MTSQYSERDLEEAILSLIAAACGVERSNICPEKTLYELGGGSMTVMAIAAGLQVRLGCVFSPEQMQELFATASIRDFVGSVREYAAAS